MACHQRSASAPSSPRSNNSEVEQQLQSLSATISATVDIDTTCDGLKKLEVIYSCIDKMICTPGNQVILCQTQQRNAVEAELGRSLVVLDLCNAMQESFMELKMSVQELLLALRRGEDACDQVKSYIRLMKKAQKQFKKISKKTVSDDKDCRVMMQMAEAREVTISLLESTCGPLSNQIEMPKCSLVSKTFQKTKFVCQEEKLRALESSIGDLRTGVEFLYRRLIHNRVSLLNILSL
jgi:histidinol phosphatase-like enzyme